MGYNIKHNWKRLEFTVDLPALFEEIVRHTEVRESPGTIMGLQIIRLHLFKIATHAIEIKDMYTLTQLEIMGCVNIDKKVEDKDNG